LAFEVEFFFQTCLQFVSIDFEIILLIYATSRSLPFNIRQKSVKFALSLQVYLVL
jgi:hypothetical protein